MNTPEEPIQATIEGHPGPIKTPKQLVITVILAFLIPITVIIMLVNLVAAENKVGAGSDTLTPDAIATRIQPVADLKLVDANAPRVYKTGQEVFESTCTACHTAGVLNAPKIGDNAAWAPLIKAGYDELIKNAIHGIGAMPPKGGNAALSDYEVERAVVYMANKSGASMKEPAAPAEDKQAAAKPTAVAVAASAAQAPQAAAKEAPPAAAAATAPAKTEEAPAKPAAAVAAAAGAAAPAPAAPASAASTPAAAPAATVDPAGEKLYKSVCFACHDSGVAGAPKFGDKAAWAPFIATGMDAMVKNAIHGIGAMPPRGGSQASDAEMHAAVEYLVQAAK